MSNLSLFTNGSSVVPAYLQQPDALTKMLAGGGGGPSISIKGGVWRMLVGGEEVAKNENRAMNFVIVNAAPSTHRTFFIGKYEENANASPACWSADGVAPHADVPDETRQSPSCAECPQNIAGSGEGESRACRYGRRLAVVLENDIQGNIYRLQLPAKSLFGKAEGDKMSLEAYARFLKGHNVPISGVVTEAKFDTDEAVPVVRFRPVRPLTPEEWEDVQAAAVHPDSAAAVSFDSMPKAAAAPKASPAPAVVPAPAPAPAPVAAPAAPRGRARATPPAAAVVEETPTPAPQMRAAKPRETPPPAGSLPTDVAAVLEAWAGDDDE